MKAVASKNILSTAHLLITKINQHGYYLICLIPLNS